MTLFYLKVDQLWIYITLVIVNVLWAYGYRQYGQDLRQRDVEIDIDEALEKMNPKR